MEIQIERLSATSRLLIISLPDEEVRGEVVEKLKDLCKTITIPGFRKGRTPFKVVESRFGQTVLRDVLVDAARKNTDTYLEENSITPIYGPVLRDYYRDEPDMHKIEMYFEVILKLRQLGVEGEKIIEPKVEIADADVLETVESWRQENHKWVVVDRSARQTDRVIVDVATKIDGEVVDDGSQKNLKIEIQPDEDEFEDELVSGEVNSVLVGKACVGLHAGDEVTVPAGLGDAADEADTSTYTIKVHSIEEPTNEFTDKFLKSLGVQSEADENFLSHARKSLEQDFRYRMDSALRLQVVEALLGRNSFGVPRSLVESQVKEYFKFTGYSVGEFEESGVDWMNTEMGQYVRRFIENLLLNEMINFELLKECEHLIDSSDEAFQTHTQELMSLSPTPEEVEKNIEERPSEFKSEFHLMQVIRGLASKADYEVQSMTMQEFNEWDRKLRRKKDRADEEQPEDEAAAEKLIVDPSGQPIRE